MLNKVERNSYQLFDTANLINGPFSYYDHNYLDNLILHNLRDSIINSKNVVLSYANKDFFIHMAMFLTFQQYFVNYQYDKELEKRVSVLLLTDKQYAVDYLMSNKINSVEFFKYGFEKHRVFNQKGLFCNLDDPFFAQCNWKHILNNYYNTNIPVFLPLHFVFPVSVGYKKFVTLPRGERNKVGRKDDKQQAVFFVTDNHKIFDERLEGIDYFFIDHSRINKFVNNSPSNAIHFFETGLDDRIEYYIKQQTVFWNIDPKLIVLIPDILDDHSGTKKTNEILKETDIRNIEIVKVESKFNKELENAIFLLGRLRSKKYYSYELNLASYIVFNVTRMPVSALQYDNVAEREILYDTLFDSLKELKDSEHRFEDEQFEILLKNLEDIFIKGELDQHSPKLEYLLSYIRKANKDRQSIGIVVSNKIISISLKEQLSLQLNIDIVDFEKNGINFYSRKEMLSSDFRADCDLLIMYSAINLNDLNVLQLFNYKKAVLFLYNVEINRLKRKLINMNKIQNEFINYFNNAEQLKTHNLYKYIYNRLKNKSNDESMEVSLLDIETSTVSRGIINTNRIEKQYVGKKAIKAFLIEFNDSSYMFIDNTFRVKVLDKNKRENISKTYKELKQGDEIIFLNHDVRQDIYHMFLSRMDNRKKSAINFSKIEKWRMKYEDSYFSKSINDEELFKRMKEQGWDKVTKSILRNWRSGYSFGPRDCQDIVCLGQVLNIQEFVTNASEYHNAMIEIRSERIVAAKLLNQFIYGTKRYSDELSNKLASYNLTLEQLSDAINIKQVKKVYNKFFYIKPIELGVLFNRKNN